jgi:hypothetical protein
MSNTTNGNLVKEGLTAARVGDVEEARRLLRQATEERPDNVEAWLGLAGVVETLEEKRRCFTEALNLDPDNAEAQAGLARVDQKLAEKSLTTPAPPTQPERGTTSADGQAIESAETGLAVCYRHPNIETGLRCNRCGRPICPKCAVRTPVGFRCPECIREQENKYYTGGNADYLIAAVIAFPLSLIAAGLFSFILARFWILWVIFIGIIAAPAVAGFIAEAVRWGVGRRRSRYLAYVVAGSLILGTLPYIIFALLGGNFGLIAAGVFLFFGTSTVLARLR